MIDWIDGETFELGGRAFIDVHRERFVTKWYAALADHPEAPADMP
jgi:hypothetical protein